MLTRRKRFHEERTATVCDVMWLWAALELRGAAYIELVLLHRSPGPLVHDL